MSPEGSTYNSVASPEGSNYDFEQEQELFNSTSLAASILHAYKVSTPAGMPTLDLSPPGRRQLQTLGFLRWKLD
jgi:hypothetical protein